MTAIFASHAAAWAQTRAAASTLPIGSPLTIISDETVDPRVRPGSEFRAHLRDALSLGDTLVATAGTPARLVVTAKDVAKDGTPSYHIAIVGLNLGLAGTLPVRPIAPNVAHIAAGMAIPATTLATIAFEGGKIRVAAPLPFTLSNEPPNGGFTPPPLRTAAPVVNRRKPTPSPAVTAPASMTPTPSATMTPSPSVANTNSPPGATPPPVPATPLATPK